MSDAEDREVYGEHECSVCGRSFPRNALNEYFECPECSPKDEEEREAAADAELMRRLGK